MTVTLNIDNQRIRLVSQQANRIDLWETLEVPPGLIKDGLILKPAEVAALLKEHFQTSRLSAQQVRVCVTGLSFVYRVLTLPNLPSQKLKSAVERATQKEIALPLENLYVDWQVINQHEKEQEIFILGIARPMVDALINTLKMAGINMQTLELKALSLARAAGYPDALVVDCEPGAYEILVVRSGVPFTIHRVSPKNEMFTFEDNLNQMITELNRTIDFFNVNHTQNPLTQSTPVMLAGSLCDDNESRRLITQAIGQKVELFSSSLTLPPGFPISTFAANLGLLARSPIGKTSRVSPGIDLIRARQRALKRPVSAKQLLFSGAIVAALILLVMVWVLHQQAVAEAGELRHKAAGINRELVLANQELEKAKQLQTRITALSDENRQLSFEREQLGGKGETADILRVISANLPPGMTLTRITSEPEDIRVEGLTYSRQDIVNYVHTLEKEGIFTEVRIALIDTVKELSETIFTFSIVMER